MVYRVLFGITTVVVVCVSFAFRESNSSFRSLGIGEENHRGAGFGIGYVVGQDCSPGTTPPCPTNSGTVAAAVLAVGNTCTRPLICNGPGANISNFVCIASWVAFYNAPCLKTTFGGANTCSGIKDVVVLQGGLNYCVYTPIGPVFACGGSDSCSG